MKLLLIDDDRRFLDELQQTVARLCRRNGITADVTVADDAEAVLENGSASRFDVVLLDIEMPRLSGLTLAERLNAAKGCAEKPFIIFVTNREGLVFDALRLQPYSFVRKAHLEDLEPCLIRLNEACGEAFLTVKSGRSADRLALREVVYLEKQNNYVVIHTVRGDFRERCSMNDKSVALDGRGFLRPHIGYLVNMRYIAELTPQTVRLTDGRQIPVSRKYRAQVRRQFFEWMVSAQ